MKADFYIDMFDPEDNVSELKFIVYNTDSDKDARGCVQFFWNENSKNDKLIEGDNAIKMVSKLKYEMEYRIKKLGKLERYLTNLKYKTDIR